MLVGDGMGITVITGNRNVFDGWIRTTFRSATVAVNGKGFIARDLTVENTAGAAKHQAVVLRSFTGAASWDTKTLSMHMLSGNFTVNVKLLARLISSLVTQLLSSKNVRFSQDNPFLIRVTSTPLTEGKNPIKTPVLHSNFATYLLMLISRNLLTRRRHFLVDHGRNICELLLCNRQSVVWLVSKDGLNGMAILDLTHLLCRIQQYTGPGAALTDRVKWPGFHVLSRPRQAKNFTVAHFINSNVWLPRTGVVFTSGFRA